MKNIEQLSESERASQRELFQTKYNELKAKNYAFDLTRGKPSFEQVALADQLDGIIGDNFKTPSGVDARNYGGLDGLVEMKQLAAQLFDCPKENTFIGGNSSLQLMHQVMLHNFFFGPSGDSDAWSKEENKAKFLCPVPGYDRHFTICEQLGIEMINVPMNESGPDMDEVERLVANDHSIKGIWCVPKYSNPTGIVYSDDVVKRIAALGKVAASNFRIMWDNAYMVHDLVDNPPRLQSLWEEAQKLGTLDSIFMFGSMSKVTFPGAAVSYLAASDKNLTGFKKYMQIQTIGADKMNQLRHLRFFKNKEGVLLHMKKHAEIIGPKFKIVLDKLETIKSLGIATWETPVGGYFISVDTLPGLASKVVSLCADAGVKLTPAGATFPYKKDPEDRNVRISPTFPNAEDLKQAMEVVVVTIGLASLSHS